MFEDDVYVDRLGVQDGMLNYANITSLKLFARPCTGQPEVIDKGHGHAVGFLLGFYAWAGCPPMQASYCNRGVKLREREISSRIMQILLCL